jgi:hypothetical protein
MAISSALLIPLVFSFGRLFRFWESAQIAESGNSGFAAQLSKLNASVE